MLLSRHFLVAVVLAGCTLARSARAQPADAAGSADALFRSAKEAAARGDDATACARFKESERLEHAVGTLLNLAACEERRGTIAAALEHYTRARDELTPGDFRVAFTDQHIAALVNRVPRLTLRVRGSETNGRVFRDDIELGPASLGVPLPVEPGPHRCTVRAPGRADAHVSCAVAEGERKVFDLAPGPALGAAVSAEDVKPARKSPVLGYALGGVGIVGVGIGAITGLVAIDAASTYKDHCKNGICDGEGLSAASTGKTMSVVSPVAFVAGAIALGAGIYLVLAQPKQASTAVVAPRTAPSGNGFSFGASF